MILIRILHICDFQWFAEHAAYVPQETLNSSRCDELLKKSNRHLPVRHDENICARTPERLGMGPGICVSNVGGPLVANKKLIGIYSWYPQPCGRGHPIGFTRISNYIDWINKKTNLSF